MQNGTLWICTNGIGWVDMDTWEDRDGPKKGEIVTECGRISGDYLVLEEYPGIDENGEPHGWHIDQFQKLQDPMKVNLGELISEKQTA